ncbi:hypothetical protein KM043_018181 [Ampulex compressa]|nr:hypothetical protein KM043_018181 [Ampulex compressa]
MLTDTYLYAILTMKTAYPFASMRRLKILKTFVYPRRSITGCGTFCYRDDVTNAKKNHQPIIALESAIITHGMPYPHNLNTALRVEDIIRKKGAIPATIGIIHGKVHIGLTREELELLSKVDPAKTLKCSSRDLSFVISQKLNGGTTVSATILIAHLAGLSIMATGGIGGVHRNVESTWDISADLIQLRQTPIAVVCSGVKSILDIGKTLEFLETQGVPVIKIGESNEFPAFYCVRTVDKIRAPHNVSNSMGAANIIKAQRKLGLNTGILFAVPVPEKYALSPDDVESAICKALKCAKSMNVTGKNVTPFLLQELNKITGGRSLDSNMALVENNAKVATEIALNVYAQQETVSPGYSPASLITSKRNPVVIGGAVFDTILQVKDSEIKVSEN